ncbi:MAG: DNA polymerase II, partial [Vibrio sp.]
MTHHTGFLLTRHARDVGNTTSIELWLATPQGPTQLLIAQERPVFFIEQASHALASKILQSISNVELRPLDMTHFSGAAVSAVYTPTLKQSQLCQQRLRQEDIAIYETDIRLADRYLMERFIRGSIEFTGTQSHQTGYTQIRHAKCRPTDYIPNLSVVSLDFECSEKGVLYSVGLDSPMDRRVIMVGKAEPSDTPIEWVNDKKALIHALIEWFQHYDPDVIIGWNVIDFDFRLLHRRAQWHRIALRIGRGRQTSYFRSASNTQQGFITIPGRVVLDGIDTFKTATYQFRSWSLEAVSQELLGEGKAIHNVHDRMAEINHMFAHDKPSLAKYNLQDCVLVNRLFQHAHLLEFAIQRSRLTGLELDRIGGSVAAFTNLYLPQLHRAGYIAPNLQSEHWQASPGGYVMDSLPGL